ncbi:hypothetical protein BC834DRAFT_969159 [Gloeopeniophorella convolvens]|nr:hypothetical protein BC834DRAFT_969159 [Gloeopeniophorella convolvens]
MSKTPQLSLPQSPSTSTPEPAQSHVPSPLHTTPAPVPPVQSVASTSTSALPEILFPPSPTRIHRRRPPIVVLTADEEAAATRVSSKVSARLISDHLSVLLPDVETPFRDTGDVVDRLLPYHVFQHPMEDLLKAGKGKARATETEILQSELAETRFALECFKRRRALEERFRRARTKSGKRAARDDQAYYLERQVLDIERSEHSALASELRTAKAELERVTRLQRLAALPQRTNYYTPAAPVYAHHYRTYHYPYAQTYGGAPSPAQGYPYSVPLSSTITQYVPPAPAAPTPTVKPASAVSTPTTSPVSAAPATSPATSTPSTPASATTASTSAISGAIPVQLPLASMPTLHALGIIPVMAQSLTPETPTPPAVIRGASANGAMLHLEINVSLLQAAQMSGLALLLNSIMRSSGSASAVEAPPHAQVGAPYTYPYNVGQAAEAPTTTATPLTDPEHSKVATYTQNKDGKDGKA